jgi:DNA repair photolyase
MTSRKHILIRSKIPYVSHAANFAVGCAHACRYCYMQRLSRVDRARWRECRPVPFATALLEADLVKLKIEPTEVLVSSSHDAYQPGDGLPTRQVLEILARRGLPVWVLTKGCHRVDGGLLPVRDFDLLQGEGCKFGVSITTHDERERERWEPGAASTHNRLMALANAKLRGVSTWVSVEPVLPGLDIPKLARQLEELADFVVVGKWNHSREEAAMDWPRIRAQAEEAFQDWGGNLLIKSELAEV